MAPPTKTNLVSVIRYRPDLMPPPAGSTVPASAPGPVAPVVVQAPLPFPADGPALWAELHTRALRVTGRTLVVRLVDWLSKFGRRLPCGHCRQDWDRMFRDTPPDLKNLFAWTVDRHNEVNRRLGKPEISEETARALWTPVFKLAVKALPPTPQPRKRAKPAESPRGAGQDNPRKRHGPQNA